MWYAIAIERAGSHGGRQPISPPSDEVKPTGFPLEKLPAELRIEIYKLLDYGTALRFARVNKFFYYERPYNNIDKEQRATFVFYADAFAHNRARLACYECLQVRSRVNFLVEHRTGDYNKYGEREYDRRCFDCVIKKENIGLQRLWRLKIRRWQLRAFGRSKKRTGVVSQQSSETC